MKKILIIGGAILSVLVAGYFLIARGGGQKYEFRFDKVSQGDITMYVTATGTISAVTQVDVGTQVSGIVSKLYADFNSVVKEGQVIAQIDSTLLLQSFRNAEASLARVKAQLGQSQRAYARTKELFDKGLESQLNYDAALASLESDQASYKMSTASLDQARQNLAYSTIYAPISGVVIDRKVNVGQTVAASFSSPTLYTIANDLKVMQVQATVDETDIGRVSVGQAATFTVDAYPDEQFVGTVSMIRLAPVSVQNVVNYTVLIDVNNGQLKLMPGMTANVKVLVASAQNALRVPNMALRFQPSADLVDSVQLKSAREEFFAGGRPGGGSMEGMPGQGPGSEGSGGMRPDRGRMEAVRDSIQKAHGGTLSDDELRTEMRKLWRGVQGAQATPAAQVVPATKASGAGKYTITKKFPEYQKSAYVPARQSSLARIWVLGKSGKMQAIFVRTGLNDGKYTEITTNALKPGDEIVLGVIGGGNGTTTEATRSPLSGQQGRGGMMGGPPR